MLGRRHSFVVKETENGNLSALLNVLYKTKIIIFENPIFDPWSAYWSCRLKEKHLPLENIATIRSSG